MFFLTNFVSAQNHFSSLGKMLVMKVFLKGKKLKVNPFSGFR